MSISITKYIDITSSVGGTSSVPAVELSGRLYTTNPLVPTGAVIDFFSSLEVGAYFGTLSEEYARSVQYFSFINKKGTKAKRLSFARWVDVATAPEIFGLKVLAPLSFFNTIANGSLTLEMGGVTNILTGMDFTLAVSLSAVATIIQTAINAQVGLQWTGATVVYNATRKSFDLVGGDAVAATISTSLTGVGTDIINFIGWGSSAIFSYGSLAETLTDNFIASVDESDNFGSFVYMPTLSLSEHVEIATLNASYNVKFQYYVPVLEVDYLSYSAALEDIAMVGVIVSENPGFYPDMNPMETMASTDYTTANSVQNYMFQEYKMPATVTDTLTSTELDAARINYNGQTQTAGQKVIFFQRGVLMGGISDPEFMNIAANEQFLRAAATASLMNLLLNLTRIPANLQGVGQITAALTDGMITPGLYNGSISVNKTLTNDQKADITQITNDPLAWVQVQNSGYWLNVVMNPTLGEADYTFVYSKDDVIRKINGTHRLE